MVLWLRPHGKLLYCKNEVEVRMGLSRSTASLEIDPEKHICCSSLVDLDLGTKSLRAILCK